MTLKFAVVREDPKAELQLIRTTKAQRVLLVASGGCTAMALKHAFPDLDVTLFDLNSSQLEHVDRQCQAVARRDYSALNIGGKSCEKENLRQCGAMENLLGLFRDFLGRFVTTPESISDFFVDNDQNRQRRQLHSWRASPFWQELFQTCFSDHLLTTLFGSEAVRYGQPNSYAPYFQKQFEQALAHPQAFCNPFLQHIMLGHYVTRDAPPFLLAGELFSFNRVHGPLSAVEHLQEYQLVNLSNIFDWSAEAEVADMAAALRVLPEGAVVIYRQLNNVRSYRHYFQPWFEFDEKLGPLFLQQDRSFFYNRIEVARRIRSPDTQATATGRGV